MPQAAATTTCSIQVDSIRFIQNGGIVSVEVRHLFVLEKIDS